MKIAIAILATWMFAVLSFAVLVWFVEDDFRNAIKVSLIATTTAIVLFASIFGLVLIWDWAV